MSMTAACKLMHLVEAFSTPWFLLANKTNHKLVFFLLEMLNNLVQYQFDGNSNLAYTMIRKRNVFHQLANLPTDCSSIQQTVSKKSRKQPVVRSSSVCGEEGGEEERVMEGAQPALPAQPGTLAASLLALPRIESLTEGVSAHPSQSQLDRLGLTHHLKPVQPGVEKEEVEQEVEQEVEKEQRELPGPSQEGQGQRWVASPDWVREWKSQLPLQTIMRMLQVSNYSLLTSY